VDILFENSDFLAVHKPENIASIPERLQGRDSVVQILRQSRGEKLFVVHRLDKEVSGVLVFARNAAAHKYLNNKFSGREVRKSYLAVVHEVISGEGGSVSKPLRQFGSGRMGVDERGKMAETDFDVEERMRTYTVVKAYPHTGRRHQLRVHFYSIGHPVVGDVRYGDRSLQLKYPRLMLHALNISFVLPGGERVRIHVDPPASFSECLEQLRQE
jgi:RluA family pseudouridine synthase